MRMLLSSAAAIVFAVASVSASAAGADVGTRAAEASEPVRFDLFFPSRDPAGLQQLLHDQQIPGTADYQRWLTPDQFTARFGADPATVARAEAALARSGVRVEGHFAQGLHVATTAGAMQAQLGTALDHVTASNGRDTLVTRSPIALPPEVQAEGALAVPLLPIRRQVHSQRINHAVPENRNSPTGGYWFSDLKQAYDAPSIQSANGDGRTIAILMASDVLDSDMEAYFGHEGLAEPTLLHIPINGGSFFSTASDTSLEATLDVQQSGGMAPLATIRLYNIPSLGDNDVISGLEAILTDNASDVVSMSFGECEALFTPAFNGGANVELPLIIFEILFQQGNAQGITFVASSGDNGALQCPSLSKPVFAEGASHPATSPEVTAVGGTNLVTAFTPGSENSAYVSENAEGDPLVPNNPFGGTAPLTGGIWGSGGGPSIFFPRPSFQAGVNTGTTARATPDLSLHMGGCPNDAQLLCGPNRSFDIEIFGGQAVGVIGTSASAPAFAGVVALLDQLTGRRNGNLNPYIYDMALAQGKKPTAAFRRTIPGFNGVFSSGAPVPVPGVVVPSIATYNMVVGNGSVDIRQFLGVPNLPAAGVPGTASNP
jgi:subtilase family serine protease